MPQPGRNFVLQVWDGSQYLTIGGLQVNSIAISNVVVDATSHRSGGWRQILQDCGNQTITLTASGIWKGSNAESLIRQWVFDHSQHAMKALFTDNGEYFSGNFMVSKLEYTGTHNGARMYNVTLESSGEQFRT